MRKSRPRPEFLYWTCQVCGWLFYALLCSFYSWTVKGHFREYLVYNLVLAGCGLLITHFFRGFIAKTHWLGLPPGVLIARVLAPIPILALFYLCCVYLTLPLHFYLLREQEPLDLLNQHLAYWLFYFAHGLFCFGSWATIYLGLYLLRGRRRSRDRTNQRLALALSQARVDALRAPIHPHLLAQALAGFRDFIDKDASRAGDAVTRLTSILRYSLSTDASATVPFGKELSAVTDYLELELLRFEDRLRVRKQIQPEALSRPIPPMLLQTLAENAIKHGAAPSSGISEISILAAIDPVDARLLIEVRNTGHLHLEASRPTRAGLGNARERLFRLFGKDAEMKITEDPPGLVTVSVSVPNRQPSVAFPGS